MKINIKIEKLGFIFGVFLLALALVLIKDFPYNLPFGFFGGFLVIATKVYSKKPIPMPEYPKKSNGPK